MNSSGLDSQPTDNIKADSICQLATDKEQDEYNERWEDIKEVGFNDIFSLHSNDLCKRERQ